MILKKLIIYDNDILFNIIDEIKEFFNFDPIKLKKNEVDEMIKNINSDFLIISSKKKVFNNQIIINEFPIKITRLIEIINLNFLKNKFISQSELKIGQYQLNLNTKEISKDKTKLDLTERETNLIIYLSDASSAVKIDKLQRDVWSHGSKLETHTVETHIYRLRKKIKDKFQDENFIISSKEGYSIT
tara:strand:- start:565 stop:1125 length:561 start_codon:yes stop_codon:yes gene_type:complete